jgi:hypothetical protein
MLTNSAEPEMVERYWERGLQVAVITAPRPINSKVERRGTYVAELRVTPPGAHYGNQRMPLPGVLTSSPPTFRLTMTSMSTERHTSSACFDLPIG